jgi:hypothetical protein
LIHLDIRLFLFGLFQNVNNEEQSDPNYIDEVPVVRDNNRGSSFFVTEFLCSKGSTNYEKESDKTTGYVQRVETSGDVERRSVGIA